LGLERLSIAIFLHEFEVIVVDKRISSRISSCFETERREPGAKNAGETPALLRAAQGLLIQAWHSGVFVATSIF
jgi:hypothetical protein